MPGKLQADGRHSECMDDADVIYMLDKRSQTEYSLVVYDHLSEIIDVATAQTKTPSLNAGK